MKKRCRDVFYQNPALMNFPTRQDLKDLARDMTCKATGSKVAWNPPGGQASIWGVSFDDRDPIPEWSNTLSSWSTSNLRVLSHAANQVKGNSSDANLEEWLLCLMNSNMIRQHMLELYNDGPNPLDRSFDCKDSGLRLKSNNCCCLLLRKRALDSGLVALLKI